MKSIPEQVGALLRPAQETLFDLLRGIKAEQVKMNSLLSVLVANDLARMTSGEVARSIKIRDEVKS